MKNEGEARVDEGRSWYDEDAEAQGRSGDGAAERDEPQQVQRAGTHVTWAGSLFFVALAAALIALDESRNGRDATGVAIFAVLVLLSSLIVGFIGLRRHVRNADLVAELVGEKLRAEAAGSEASRRAEPS